MNKSWWGIVILIALWPLSLTYWLWKKREWNIKFKVGFLAALWGLILFGLISLDNTPQRLFKGLNSQSTEAKLQTETVITPSPTPQTSPSVETVPFDKNLGNNPVAAKYAHEFLNTASKTPGYVESIRLELAPEDMQGKDEEEYKKSVTSAFLTVQVDNLIWSTTGETTQKDLVASFLNALNNTFSGFPHVYVTNGVRTVAEAELSFSGEPKIELK